MTIQSDGTRQRNRITKVDVMRSLVEDPALRRVFNMIHEAIAYSFAVEPCRITRDEITRRFNMCYGIWKELRAEMRYPLVRIEECLGQYLTLSVRGDEWNPLKRRTWVPGDPVSKKLEGLPKPFVLKYTGKLHNVYEELAGHGFGPAKLPKIRR